MMKLFKKIKKEGLSKKQIRKYFLYAVGEVILIIVGILMALQINNWNEQSKSEEKVVTLFKGVLNDLEDNIYITDFLITELKKEDSIAGLILNNNYFKEDFIKNQELKINNFFELLYFTNKTYNSYNNLTKSIQEIPDDYKDLMSNLNVAMVGRIKSVNESREDINVFLRETDKYLSTNTTWYSNELTNKKDEQALIFYTQNPIYKNLVASFKNKLSAYSLDLKILRESSLLNYYIIRENLNLNSTMPDFIPKNAVLLNDLELSKYLGCYLSSFGTIFIEKHKSFLLYGSKTQKSCLLYTDGNGDFINGIGQKFKFIKDLNGKVLSMHILEENFTPTKTKKLENCY